MSNQKETSKKHYSSTEKTGLTSNETKERAILNHLFCWFCDDVESKTCILKPNPNRRDLMEKIKNALTEITNNPIDRYTVYKFIDLLLTKKYITHNPTSDKTPNKHILPNNDTRYFLNPELIERRFNELSLKMIQKGKTSLSVTLDQYKQDSHVEGSRIGKETTENA